MKRIGQKKGLSGVLARNYELREENNKKVVAISAGDSVQIFLSRTIKHSHGGLSMHETCLELMYWALLRSSNRESSSVRLV